MPLTRRDLAAGAATGAGGAPAGSAGVPVAGPEAGATSAGPANGVGAHGPGHGPLVPGPDGILALPAGFSYRIVPRTGVTTPDSGASTPPHHDGTGASAGPRAATPPVDGREPAGPRSDRPHPVPPAEGPAHDDHAFESVPDDLAAGRAARPLTALGRFACAAVVADPRRGHLYLTENAGTENAGTENAGTENAGTPDGLLYRWTPPPGFRHGRGRLRDLADDAGVLAAARCYDSGGRFVDDLSRATRPGTVHGVDWIEVPDRAARTVPVRRQFDDGEITRARRPAGMWWADGGAYLVFSSPCAQSPGRHAGQVWFLDPGRRTLTLTLRFGVNPAPERDGAYDGPGTISVSPHTGPIGDEDGEGVRHPFGATGDGRTRPVARGGMDSGTAGGPEHGAFTGPVLPPDGRTLVVSLQEPGLMVAVTGPWRRQDRPGHRR
ncbi:alkaline phosphatase PhoX [Streptomyces sp. NPDC014733]|uniref:alkaline phosphatase PhoX n=1 Tax=Streptomyces sp. NPDC014733 TaxID=3364885 RepID=UPI0037030985